MVEATFSIFPSDQDLYKNQPRGMLLDRRNHGYQGGNTDKRWQWRPNRYDAQNWRSMPNSLLLPRLKYHAILNEITLKGDTQKVQIDK